MHVLLEYFVLLHSLNQMKHCSLEVTLHEHVSQPPTAGGLSANKPL